MFQPQLGLKGSSSRKQIDDRLRHQPQVYEFFTAANDFTPEGYQHLREAIQYVQLRGVHHIILHHPMNFGEYHADVVAPEKDYPELYRFIEETTAQLIRLADDLNVQVLVHGGYAGPTVEHMVALYPSVQAARDAVYQRLDHFARAGGDPAQEDEILAHHYRLAFDTSHCFIELHGDNQGLQASLSHLAPAVVHYHLVDSLGQTHDSLTLGSGKIDWAGVLPLLNPKASSIYEINLRDQSNFQEQLESHAYLSRLANQLTNQEGRQ